MCLAIFFFTFYFSCIINNFVVVDPAPRSRIFGTTILTLSNLSIAYISHHILVVIALDLFVCFARLKLGFDTYSFRKMAYSSCRQCL